MKGLWAGFVTKWVVLCGVLLALQSVPRVWAAEAYECQVEWLSNRRLLVTLTIQEYSARSVTNRDGNMRTAFHLTGAPNTLKKGSPSLPYVAVALPVPYEGATVRVVEASYEELLVAPPLPSRGSVVAGSAEARAPLEEGAAYSDTVVWPRREVVLKPRVGNERELRLLLHPFRFNPHRGSVLLARSMTVEVNVPRGVPEGVMRSGGRGEPRLRGAAAGRGQLLVVYAKVFEDALRDFFHFKRMSGLTVEAASYSPAGDAELKDTVAIRQRIKEVYTSAGGDLRYVLFVGDFNLLPSRSYQGLKYSKTWSDWVYSPVSPRFAEGQVAFGRLPASTVQELELMLDKIVRYEQGDLKENRRLAHALGIASGEKDLGYGDRSDAQHMEYLGSLLKKGGYLHVENLLDDSTGMKVSVEHVVQAVNHGVGLINYIGHGFSGSWKTSSMATADALKLKNRGPWPLVISAACDNGLRRSGAPSFAEGWLLAQDGGEPTGAIAFTGATDNILWEEPMQAQEQMNILLLRQGQPAQPILTLGDIFTHGLVKMIEAYGGNPFELQSADVWLLFGDPSVPFRTTAVRTAASSLPKSVVAGVRHMPIACDADGSVVTLCRRRTGEPPRYVSAVSSGGRALLTNLDLAEGDEVELAVVRANGAMQWVKNIPVQPLQERKLLAYPVVKVLEQTQQVALERDGRLELTLDVVNASGVELRAPLPLLLEVTPQAALKLLPESSPLSLPPLGIDESLGTPIRFCFRVKDVQGVESVRVRLWVEWGGGRKVLVDKVLPYLSRVESQPEPEEPALLLSPNPTQGIVRLQVQQGIARARVFNLFGSCVLDLEGNSLQELTVDTFGLANGLYLAEVESVDGTRLVENLIVSR